VVRRSSRVPNPTRSPDESRKTATTEILDVLIAHDQELVRLGLKELLSNYPNMRICGETATTTEILQQVKKLQPDVLFLKLGLPNMNVAELVPELRNTRPSLKILLMASEGPNRIPESAVLTPAVAQTALQGGVAGILLRPDVTDIRLAIEAISKSKFFISSNVFLGLTVQRVPSIEPEINRRLLQRLTAKEKEILGLIAKGKTSKEISLELGNSSRTVEGHRANIMRKLGCSSHNELIRYILERPQTSV
jgi:DNA-binding NarL/FixJ family response regulator